MRIVVAVVIALACQRAHANSPLEPPDQPVVASYRGATLAADGVAVGLVAVGIATETNILVLLGVSTYLVVPPLKHVTNERNARAAASVAMRVGLPLLGVLIGDSLPRDCGPTGDCAGPPLAIYLGLGAGVVAAAALDGIFLAKGDSPPSQPRAAWTPVARPTHGGFALGVAGQF
ncbi:MAG TPA: hypothetical protein VIV11_34630 [Kofleriaceae bacterium]